MTPSFTFAPRIWSSFCHPVALVALLAVCFWAGTLTQVHAQVHVVINEVDADTPGSDTAEFVELYNTSNAQVTLDGLVLVFFNGSSDQSYNALDLDGHTIAANGYFVIGNTGVANVTVTFTNNGLQNGADAVALYTGDATDFPNGTTPTQMNLIDALVYDTNDSDDAGLLTGLGQTTQFNEGENGNKDAHSNSRATDGTGAFVAKSATPGTTNTPLPTCSSTKLTPIPQAATPPNSLSSTTQPLVPSTLRDSCSSCSMAAMMLPTTPLTSTATRLRPKISSLLATQPCPTLIL